MILAAGAARKPEKKSQRPYAEWLDMWDRPDSEEQSRLLEFVNDRFAQTETLEVESLRFEMIAMVYRMEYGKLLEFAEAAGLSYQKPPHIAEKLRQ